LGYDHITDEQASLMEPLEIAILATIDIPNPYNRERS
jgi:ssRNA-specific RNase YbeY (16S rRNA maturation enzyme)